MATNQFGYQDFELGGFKFRCNVAYAFHAARANGQHFPKTW